MQNIYITDFGAIGNGLTINTEAIQRAIDYCATGGGGRVCIPRGIFKCGTIWLKSGIELHLEMGAELLASDDMDDYNELDAFPQNFSVPVEEWVGKHLIIAHEISNCAITGLGTINGNCHAFVDELRDYPQYHNGYIWSFGMSKLKDAEKQRPGQLICFIECTNVTVTDVTVKDSPCWSLYFLGCEYVTVRGFKAFNPIWMMNSDGIDVDSSRFVTISDCIIETGDDAIAIRACEDLLQRGNKHCEYITVSNCALSTGICAVRVGVGSGLIRNVRISNIVISRACNAIQLCTAYSPTNKVDIEDVNFSGISAANTDRLIEAFAKNGASIRGVTIENVRTTSSMENYVDGSGGTIDGITLRNVDLSVFDKFPILTEELLRERGKHSFRITNAENITLEGVKLSGELCGNYETAIARGCEPIVEKCNFTVMQDKNKQKE